MTGDVLLIEAAYWSGFYHSFLLAASIVAGFVLGLILLRLWKDRSARIAQQADETLSLIDQRFSRIEHKLKLPPPPPEARVSRKGVA